MSQNRHIKLFLSESIQDTTSTIRCPYHSYHHLYQQYKIYNQSKLQKFFKIYIKPMKYALAFIINFMIIVMVYASNKKNISSQVQKASVISNSDALVSSVYGDTTLALNLQNPKQISNIIDIEIIQKQQVCSIKSVQLQPQISQIFSVKLNQTVINQQWNSQIIASTYSQKGNKAYVLLDNSTLIITQLPLLSQNSSVVKKHISYSFQAIGSTAKWLKNKYQLFLHNDNLFMLQNQQFSKIQLHHQGFWTKDKAIKNEIISVKYFHGQFYILSSKNLTKYSQKAQTEIYKGKKLIDFTISGGNYYILDEEDGLISLNPTKKEEIFTYSLEQSSKAKYIQIVQNTLFIVYEIQKRNYIAEFFMEKNNSIKLNRYYYNYNSIKSLILQKHYGLIDSYNQFTLFRHSVNRNNFQSLEQVQNIYKSHGNRIVNIKLQQNVTVLSFLITFKDKIIRYQFDIGTNLSKQQYNSMNTLKVECSSYISAQYPVSIVYKGVCSSDKYNPKYFLCSETKIHLLHFQYNLQRKKNQYQLQHLLNILILVTVIVFSCLYIFKKIRNCCKMHDEIEKKYNQQLERKSNYDNQAEKTFNNDLK